MEQKKKSTLDEIMDVVFISYEIVGVIIMFSGIIKPKLIILGLLFVFCGIILKVTRLGAKLYFDVMDRIDFIFPFDILCLGLGHYVSFTTQCVVIAAPIYFIKVFSELI